MNFLFLVQHVTQKTKATRPFFFLVLLFGLFVFVCLFLETKWKEEGCINKHQNGEDWAQCKTLWLQAEC